MTRAGRQVLGLLGLLILWELVARAGWLNPLYAPAPHQVGQVLLELFSRGTIWPHIHHLQRRALGPGLGGGGGYGLRGARLLHPAAGRPS